MCPKHFPLCLQATGKQIVFVSRCIVVAFGVLSGVLAIILMKIGLSLGWVYLVSVRLNLNVQRFRGFTTAAVELNWFWKT